MRNLIIGIILGIGATALAAGVAHTVPSTSLTCSKWGLRWMPDGTRIVDVSCNDSNGNEKYHVPFKLDANNVYDRFGNVVFAQGASFKTALSTIETQIDGALTSLEASGALSPP